MEPHCVLNSKLPQTSIESALASGDASNSCIEVRSFYILVGADAMVTV